MFDFDLLAVLPPQLTTFIVAMLPISELRGAIPLAVFGLGLSAQEAFFWSVLGNSLVGVLVTVFLEAVSIRLRRLYVFDRFFDWLFERTRKKYSKRFEKYEALALCIIVAIPLPMTGAWSGAAAAFVFGIKTRLAVPMILIGVLAAGTIVTLITTGAIQLDGFLRDLFAYHS